MKRLSEIVMHKGLLVRKMPRKRNRDGTWRKKRSDAGKKREKTMSDNAQFDVEQEVSKLNGEHNNG
jgi:hypothetical protein